MTAFEFIICSLACFRLTRLITDDDGPGFIFRKLRRLPQKRSSVRKGISCPFCVSFYFALAISVFEVLARELDPYQAVIVMPAIWGASVLLNQTFVKLSK